MKQLTLEAGMADSFEVASAAVSSEEIWHGIGNPVDARARRELEKRNIPADPAKRARLLTAADYAHYDLLIGMDSSNMAGMRRILGSDPAGKLRCLGAYTSSGEDIADPWYFGHFDEICRQIEEGCRGLLAQLRKEGGR